VGGVHLNVFGPSPVARGGELRFIGSGMNQINSVEIPGCDAITDIKEISDEEIRVTVPQEAQVGHVTLHYGGDETIVTKTLLTYTEPIAFDSFSPKTVKPGEQLTINGEYLNLIKEVCFSFVNDSVVVSQDAFIKHERKQIVLVVPEEAISGKIIISDGGTIPNMIYSEDDLEVVLPSVETALDITKAKPGDLITITGSDLDLVRTIELPNGNSVDFKLVDENKLTFVLPSDASDGSIVMIPASGVRVAIANIGMVVPTELVAVPSTGLRAKDELTIKGLNMDQVASVSFPNIDEALVPTSITGTEIKINWPENAQSGNVILNLKSRKTVYVNVQTAKPENLTYSTDEIPAGSVLTINGRNLDLVKTIEFAGSQVVDIKNSDAAKLEVNVPILASSGAPVLTMANGEVVIAPYLNVSTPETAYINVFPGDDEEINAGTILKVGVGNADKLTSVLVGGVSVQYICNGGYLYINLPESAGGNTTIKLVSSNGSIDYTFDIIPATHVSNTIWTGAWTCSNWGGNQDLAWGGYDWSAVPAGATLTLYVTATTDDWWCISLRHGNGWGNLPDPISSQYDTPVGGVLSVTLTRGVLDDIIANGGLVITGDGYILSKVVVEWENETGVTIWTGEFDNSGWAGNQDLAWGGYDWSTVKAGKTLVVYGKLVNEGAWGCISLRHGNGWGNLPNSAGGQFDWTSDMSSCSLVLTQEILDDIVANGGLVITGDNILVTTVRIE
jgi:hypothetical protein